MSKQIWIVQDEEAETIIHSRSVARSVFLNAVQCALIEGYDVSVSLDLDGTSEAAYMHPDDPFATRYITVMKSEVVH